MLSQAYATAEGVPRDLTKALALARAACDTDGVEGCASVGIMTADGKGTPKDVDAALPYLSFACRRAVQPACAKLLALGKPLPELDM
jgi:TPR repeat protein